MGDVRLVNFASANSPEGAPNFDADADAVVSEHEFLAGTGPRIGERQFFRLLLWEN